MEYKLCICNKCSSIIKDSHLRCGRCQITYYCNSTCQTEDWNNHKKTCVKNDDLIAIRKLFSKWHNNKDEVFQTLFSKHKDYNGTLLIVLNKTMFRKFSETLDYKLVETKTTRFVLVNYYLHEKSEHILVCRVYYYFTIKAMVEDISPPGTDTTHMAGFCGCCPAPRHLMLTVPDASFMMDIMEDAC